MSRVDLGPLLACVTDEWEPAITIADRAGIDRRTAGQKLGSLARDGMVAYHDNRALRARVYRRGPHAPAVITPRDNALAALRDLDPGDPECAQSDADQILLDLIDDPEITEAFEAINKWYA